VCRSRRTFCIVKRLRSVANPIEGGRVVFRGVTSHTKAYALIESCLPRTNILVVPDERINKRATDRVLRKAVVERAGEDLSG
jgi:hypothetical protein